jgi:3',5'-cyclic AMP phosphodiesterase CpdA
VPGGILHVSDLHVGARDGGREALEDAVARLAEALRPELVVASGDLTHRNRPREHARAAAFLRSLGPPVLAVPGNHDLPPLPPSRLTSPFAAFLREWAETEPVYRSTALHVCGINSVRPWKYQRGGVGDAQLARVRDELARASASALRVVVLHHHLATPPWRAGKLAVPRRAHVLAGLARAGAELVLGGHTHQGLVVDAREFTASPAGGALVLAAAPGLWRPRPGRSAEACGLAAYEADGAALVASSYAWREGRLVLVADRRFTRATGRAPACRS